MAWAVSLTLAGATALFAADPPRTDAPGPLPGHSVHGGTFDEGPRRAAYLMGQTGDVHFPISTRSDEAQKFFDQGIGQLHGFWYFEAERSFRQVAALDRDCAMAYWGMAMANISNARRARGFIAEAVKRKTGTALSDRESRWIDILDAFYKDEPKQENDRKKNLLSAMKKLSADFPDDLEGKAFYAFYSWEYRAVGNTGGGDKATNKLIDEILKVAPNHPAHHYRIHLLDNGGAEKALPSAARCGQSAPGIAHMWHMPGHIYSDLNRYEDAAWQQEAGTRVDHAYMIRDRVMPYQIHNYAHNNEWLIRDLNYVGRVRDAIELAKNMIELPRHPKYNVATNRGSGAEYGRTRLIDVLSQHEMWEEYLTLCNSVYLQDETGPEQQIRKLRYQGVAQAAIGKVSEAKAAIVLLEKQRSAAKLAAAKPTTVPSTRPATPAAAPATQPATAGNRRNPRGGGGGRPGAGGAGDTAAIDRAVAHINAQLAIQAKDYVKAIDLLNQAQARKEHLSRVYLKSGNTAKAEELARKAADDTKRTEAYPLANLVIVLHSIGKKDDAKKAFEQLRSLSAGIDITSPPYRDLADIASEFGCGSDWRLSHGFASDTGKRPELDALGPFRWTPSKAPDFKVTGADGKPVTLDQYSGKPVVVIFYLGASCLHCTRQLQAFAPKTKDFKDAGIALLAISTDNPDDLHRAWDGYKSDDGGKSFPFPLASDGNLDVFKRYHCHDDFEKAPLHGTFLIDANGLIRWQDIGADPFMDVNFLITESKRLLAQGNAVSGLK